MITTTRADAHLGMHRPECTWVRMNYWTTRVDCVQASTNLLIYDA